MDKSNFYYKREDATHFAAVIAAIMLANALIWVFSGNAPWNPNPYNSYALQAEAWLNGRLDLGRDYGHLELAVYNGAYFVSFPPFPSMLLLPFAAFFGSRTPDHLLALLTACLSGAFALKLALVYTKNRTKAAFFSLFLCVSSNYLFLTNTGYVWFLAQNMAFCCTLIALYYACREEAKPGLSLFFLCCAVGCRPLNAVYILVLLPLLYKSLIKKHTFGGFIKRLSVAAIPAVSLGCVYMALNYARFGNIFEFGHNYLPEFTAAQHGQFSARYLLDNVKTLFRLPEISGGRVVFQRFNGTAFWLVSPIALTYACVFLRGVIKKDQLGMWLALPAVLAAHLLLLCLHKTMGGWHFGHRYTVDILPVLYLGLARLDSGETRTAAALSLPLFVAGLCINVIGTCFLYLGYL